MTIQTTTKLFDEDNDQIILENIEMDGDEVVLTADSETEIRVPKDLWAELNDAVAAKIAAAE
jgi:hypothetical protein